MATDKKTYSIPQDDSQVAMASEPLAVYKAQPVQEHIVLTVPKGVDADAVRTKVNTYYTTLLQNMVLEQEFNYHYDMWIKETGPLSSPFAIADNEHFRSIVKMGKPIVPLIVEKMKNDYSLIYLALEQIFQERMLKPQSFGEDHLMYSWMPEENTRLWIERLS